MTETTAETGGIGASLLRKEDRRLVAGRGTYVDDIALPGMAHAVFIRSPHAHARIVAIDTARAVDLPGVLAVLTGADARRDGIGRIPHATGSSKAGSDVPLANRDGTERLITPQEPLAVERAMFVGEPVVMVVAETLAAAKDAADRVEVTWDAQPAVARSLDAARDDAPRLWEHVPGNVALDGAIGDAAETERAFEAAAHRVRLTSAIQRVTGVHMEPRACIGEWDTGRNRYTIHGSHGLGAVLMRGEIARCLGVDETNVRVVAPSDVGGNFGTRNATYPEMILVAWAARRLRRPVKATADRGEALLSDFQGRDLHVDAELALDADGNFLALRSVNTANVGAYTTSFVPLNKGAQMMTSPYRVPAAHVQARAVVTNTPATIPYRSAGRPEAIFSMERLIDLAARQCGFDRVELRRRNMLRADEQPYRNAFAVTYDNGDYLGVMDEALRLADWQGFAERRRAARRVGRHRGISIANYIETTSGVPRERADIVVDPAGTIDVVIGTQSTGQGHETSFAQVVADWLGLSPAQVRVRFGDTDFVKAGGGSHSGRSMRFGSLVMHESSLAIVERARAIAAALFEVSREDVVYAQGVLRVAGTDRQMSLFDAAREALVRAALPDDLHGPLAASSDKVMPGLAFPYGAAVCEVEVDADTGTVAIVRYTSVDDVGRAVNPMILHGQTHGGIAQGAGQALMENMCYDPATGQNLSASFMDYAMPRASDFPSFTTALSEVPATSHPLGFRPGGEGGTTPALASVVNAIVDALSEFGVTHIDMPATPFRVWQALRAAERPNTSKRARATAVADS